MAEEKAPTVMGRLPVKELTVFKDGHAFVLHAGTTNVDDKGNVVLDQLPTPVVGTFWPFATDKNAKLHSVNAGKRVVRVERTALTLRDLVEANAGADVVITEVSGAPYPARIEGFLARSTEELAATSPPGSGEVLTQKSDLLLLKSAEGTRAINFARVQDVKFLGKVNKTLATEEHRNLLTLQLAWAGGKPEKTAEVGMSYLQKGVRWIPSYKIELDGKGKAAVKLQATLINELTDLENVSVNLVVGVPSFAFKDMTDPVALNQTVTQLSPHFDPGLLSANAFSNAMMTQVALPRHVERAAPAAGVAVDLGPDVGGSGKNEDLFIYTVKGVTLKKGERLVLPVSQTTMDYKDVYTLEVPFGPPAEYRQQLGNDQQRAELARLMAAPKVMHKVRLHNNGDQPMTTAPALLLKDGKLLGQGMMTYAARGADVDVDVTTAIDVKVKKTDKETKRTPNAATYNGDPYWRIDLAGSLSLTNLRGQAVEVEVVRNVLGNVGEATEGGKAEMVNVLEDDSSPGSWRPVWWAWYSWPHWWYHFNGMGRVAWKVKLEPGKSVDLGYTWHYYWR
jgi:hypothetical protein